MVHGDGSLTSPPSDRFTSLFPDDHEEMVLDEGRAERDDEAWRFAGSPSRYARLSAAEAADIASDGVEMMRMEYSDFLGAADLEREQSRTAEEPRRFSL